ncbi:hypothetical protein B8W67_20035 [Mycolicibacillus koreensis]|uniref:Uncharacterized protein n=1 Tax=Mycolicibacillus koreensis TaxID=1069220 RepID=A0AA91SPX2_9MYCO|nr:hypothetical protein B8W67_20035 [Mycolicibacillus koreensis]
MYSATSDAETVAWPATVCVQPETATATAAAAVARKVTVFVLMVLIVPALVPAVPEARVTSFTAQTPHHGGVSGVVPVAAPSRM